jgi:predicted RND superfamily exporter protein
MNFWTKFAGLVLRNRYLVLITIAIITGLLSTQFKYMKFSYTEANLLPKDNKAIVDYDKFLDIFGEEGTLVILAVKDSSIFTPKKFNAWNDFVIQFDSIPEVDYTLSLKDIQQLKADRKNRKFVLEPLYKEKPNTILEIENIKEQLFKNLPFYDNLLFNI